MSADSNNSSSDGEDAEFAPPTPRRAFPRRPPAGKSGRMVAPDSEEDEGEGEEGIVREDEDDEEEEPVRSAPRRTGAAGRGGHRGRGGRRESSSPPGSPLLKLEDEEAFVVTSSRGGFRGRGGSGTSSTRWAGRGDSSPLELPIGSETEAIPDSEDGRDDDRHEEGDATPVTAGPSTVPSRPHSLSDLSEITSSAKSASPPPPRRRGRPARKAGVPSTKKPSAAKRGPGRPSGPNARGRGGKSNGTSTGSEAMSRGDSLSTTRDSAAGDDEDPDHDPTPGDESSLAVPPPKKSAASGSASSTSSHTSSKPKQMSAVAAGKKPEQSASTSYQGGNISDSPALSSPIHSSAESGSDLSDAESEDAAPTPKSSTPAIRGRGRPRGSKRPSVKARTTNKSLANANPPKRPTAPPAAKPKPKALPPTPNSPLDTGSPMSVRATRATVTLPPGYIEGVKSARMTRIRSESQTPAPRAVPPRLPTPPPIVVDAAEVEAVVDEVEEEVAPPTKAKKSVKGKEKEIVKQEVVEVQMDVDVEPVQEVVKEEAPEEKEPEKEKPKEKGKGKGKDSAPGSPAPSGTPAKEKGKEKAHYLEPERTLSKRRKVDLEAVARGAERAAAKLVMLEQLEQEAEQIRNATHPLLDLTYHRLVDEKADRLGQLARCLEQQEMVYDKLLYANTQAVWRQWADNKDTLRTDLYLDNHVQLKELIYEEKAYPFLRDHPLLVNTHGLPPVPYYRGPLSLQAAQIYPPRKVTLSAPPLEPPPLNAALNHEMWGLSAGEIEEDMATLADYSQAAVPIAPPPPPPQRYSMSPYHYYDSAPAGPPSSLAYRSPAASYQPSPPPPPTSTPSYPSQPSWAGSYDHHPPPPPPSLPSTAGNRPTNGLGSDRPPTFDKRFGPPPTTASTSSSKAYLDPVALYGSPAAARTLPPPLPTPAPSSTIPRQHSHAHAHAHSHSHSSHSSQSHSHSHPSPVMSSSSDANKPLGSGPGRPPQQQSKFGLPSVPPLPSNPFAAAPGSSKPGSGPGSTGWYAVAGSAYPPGTVGPQQPKASIAWTSGTTAEAGRNDVGGEGRKTRFPYW